MDKEDLTRPTHTLHPPTKEQRDPAYKYISKSKPSQQDPAFKYIANDGPRFLEEIGITGLFWIYQAIAAFTFIALMTEDAPDIRGIDWLIIIPINAFLSQIWPLYWGILNWIM